MIDDYDLAILELRTIKDKLNEAGFSDFQKLHEQILDLLAFIERCDQKQTN